MELIWSSIHDFWLAHFDPFYGYVLIGIAICALVTAASWYFPVLRSLAGAIVFATVAALFGFRKGQKAEDERNDAKKRNEDRWRW